MYAFTVYIYIYISISQKHLCTYLYIFTRPMCYFSMQCSAFWKLVSTCMDSYIPIHKSIRMYVYFYICMCVTKCAVELGRCIFFVLLCGCAYVIGCLEPALFPQRQTSIVHIKYIHVLFMWMCMYQCMCTSGAGIMMQVGRQHEFETEQCIRLKLVRLPEI